jgi:invasion protein IalB
MKTARRLPRSLAVLSAAALALGLAAGPRVGGIAMAQEAGAEPESIGTFGDWQAVTFDESGKKGCYITSKPTKEEGQYSQRGRVYVLVTHRPADKSYDVVSVVAGYTYGENGDVTLTIDQTDFDLFTHQDSAWAPDSATDKALVDAMKKGNSMVVRGTSSRGTKTTDTYSLSGFTKAYQAIAEACPR